MTDVASLSYDIDASSVDSATTSLDRHTASAGRADKAATGLISAAKASARSFDQLRSQYDSGYSASKRWQAVQAQVAAAVKSGATSQSIANGVLDEARRSILGVLTPAEKLAVTQLKTEKANQELARSYTSLRAAIDPVFAASKSYESAQETVNNAVKQGVISQTEANRVLAMAEQRFLVAGDSAMAMGGKLQASNHHATNMMFQFQDIGMMLAAGQSPLMLALQQGSQVAGIFKQMESSGGSAFSVIKGGLVGLISPTSLLTIGTIAAVAAVTQWGMAALKAGDDGRDFGEVIEDIDSKIAAYRANIIDGTDAISFMREEFGEFSTSTVELAERLQSLRLREVMLDASAAAGELTNAMGGWSGTASQELANLIQLLQEFEYTGEASASGAWRLRDALDAIRAANGPQDQLAAIKAMRVEFESIIDVAGDMTDEQAAYYKNLLLTEQKLGVAVSLTSDASSATSSWAGSMAGVRVELNAIAAVIASLGGGAITAAAKRTELAALKAGTSIRDAALAASEFKENLRVDAQVAGLESKFGKVGTVIGGLVKGNLEYNRSLDAQLVVERDIALERERAAAVSARGGGGGSGGGGGGTDARASNLESIIESLQTESETLEIWRQEQFGLLAQYNDAELEAIGGKNEAKLRLEQEYQERLRAIEGDAGSRRLTEASSLFSSLASIAQTGGDKTLKIVATVQAIEGTINAYGAAIKALNTPGIGLAGRFAAYASVLAAGLKGVAAIKSAGGGSSGGSSSSGTSTAVSGTSTSAATPTSTVRLSYQGPEWMQALVEDITTHIYENTADGTKVVFTR